VYPVEKKTLKILKKRAMGASRPLLGVLMNNLTFHLCQSEKRKCFALCRL